MSKKKSAASSLLWPGVRIYHADPDEELDAAETADQMTVADSVVADENLYVEEAESETEVRIRSAVGKNTPRSAGLEVSLQPILNPTEAESYTSSAAPASRGSHERMCSSILSSDKRVFA